MTDPEAALARYIAAAGPRLGWLRERAASSGGPAAEHLDLGPDSLVPLWGWAMTQLRLRPPDAPFDPGRAPMWCAYPVPSPNTSYATSFAAAFDDGTLELIDGLVYYYGESLIRARPGAHWAVGHLPERNYVAEGRPVVAGLAAEIDPLSPVSTAVGRVFADPSSPYYNGPATPSDLRRFFDATLAATRAADARGGTRR